MRVLVTGAAGFVGRHMIDAFEARGDEVFGIDLVPSRHASVTVYDALDLFRGLRTLEHVDLVVHCAATIGGRTGIDGTPLAVATNFALDAWFFRWLEQARVPRAVYFSSSAAYPVDLQNDFAMHYELREDDIRVGAHNIGRPDATYGLVKLVGELLAEHARGAGVDVLVVRPFSGYGEDQSLDYPFPSIIRRALNREEPFDIWGSGRQVRDWIHVSDVVGAVLAALDAGEQGPLNLGTGVGTSFDELAAMVIAQIGDGYDPAIRHLENKPAGVAHRVADPARMLKLYRPRVSLKEGIARALAVPAVLRLAHGESVKEGAVTAMRAERDWRFEDPREVVFYKRYQEGKIYWRVTDEVLKDMAADVWTWVEERLDKAAREQHGHHRDGTPV